MFDKLFNDLMMKNIKNAANQLNTLNVDKIRQNYEFLIIILSSTLNEMGK